MSPTPDPLLRSSESMELFDRLVGSEQRWLALCGAVARRDETGARAVLDLTSPENAALRSLGHPRVARIDEPVDSHEGTAASAIRELAVMLSGSAPPGSTVDDVLDHFSGSGVVSVGLNRATDRVRELDEVWQRDVDDDLLSSGSPARGFVRLLCRELLSTARERGGAHVTVPVVFDDAGLGRGESGQLTLRRLSSGPGGLHPDPTCMSFLRTDQAMTTALRHAWSTSRLAGSDWCVVWSLRTHDASRRPILSVEGGSLGGAFAVALDELATRTGWLRSMIHPRVLDSGAVVSAGVDDSGRLLRVDGLATKVEVASRRRQRLVVATAALEEARAATTTGSALMVSAAADVRAAVAATRRTKNPRFRLAALVSALLVIAVPLASGIIVRERAVARTQALAADLASQAVMLSNSDPLLAAQLALASDALHPGTTADEAMAVVSQNNAGVSASRQLGHGGIVDVAVSGTTVLVSDDSHELTVLSTPDLVELGTIEVSSTSAPLGAGAATEFAVVDEDELKIYAGADGKVPVLVETVPLGFGTSQALGSPALLGPVVDSSGGILVMTSDLQGGYWSPVTRALARFDLSEDSGATVPDGLTSISVMSQFGPDVRWISGAEAGEPINASTGQSVFVATNLGEVFELRLDVPVSVGSTPAVPAPVWLDGSAHIVPDRGSQILSLGWSGEDLLVGTDVGISAWDPAGGVETAFPYGGLVDPVSVIEGVGGFGWQAAAVTEDGITLLDRQRGAQLNNVTRAAGFRDPVESLAAGPDGTWVAGRTDGAVVVITPGGESRSISQSSAAAGVAADGTILLSAGSQQYATGITRVDPESGERLAPDYRIGDEIAERVYLNDVAGDGTLAVAGGVRGDAGAVYVWERPGGTPHVLDFSDAGSGSGYDIVSSVAYDPAAGVISAYNVSSGSVAFWSTQSWERVGLVDLRAATTDRTSSSLMSASLDGSRIAVSVDGQTTVIDAEARAVLERFPASAAVISPDGTALAAIDEEGVSLLDLDGTTRSRTATDSPPDRVAWSPDGSRLALVFRETRRMVVIDTATLQQVNPAWSPGDDSYPELVVWTSDARLLTTLSSRNPDGLVDVEGVVVVDPEAADWTTALCAIASRPITEEEWRRAGGAGVSIPEVCDAAAP